MSDIPNTVPRFLWRFSRPYTLSICGLILVALLWAVNMAFSPYIAKLIVDAVADSTSRDELLKTAGLPAVGYVVLCLILGLVYRFHDWLILRIFPKMKSEITQEMFDYIKGHSYSFFQHNFAGSIANKINDMGKAIVKIITLIEYFVFQAFCIAIGAVAMYLVHPYFALIMLGWSFLFVLTSIYFSKRASIRTTDFSEAGSGIVGKMVDSITNTFTIKLFAREKFESHHLRSFLGNSVEKDRRFHWYVLKIRAYQSLIITAFVACMMWLLIEWRSRNLVTIGDFPLVLWLTGALIDSLFSLATELIHLSEENGTCRQALSILAPWQEPSDAPNAKPLVVSRGEIAFERVHFRYKDGQHIFTDKSIVIRPGERAGLVGFSGSGKSTFVNLILRLFDVDSGCILIDGQNIRTVTQASLRSQIAMIPQDPVLFHRSIMDNIRYGRLDATDEEVIECSKKAHSHEFIEKLKDGYHSLIGERGVRLSGGQRQRIAIARALLKDAPILILDEATSSLDSETEQHIQESLGQLMQGRTTIVIAHRLSTLFHMDRILVFNKGRIVEDGGHEALIARNGHYARLWSLQGGGLFFETPKRGAHAEAPPIPAFGVVDSCLGGI